MKTLVVRGGRPLRGVASVPGDKSISHRAAILGAMAAGETVVSGYLQGEDCRATLSCLEQLGATVDQSPETATVRIAAPRGLIVPDSPLYVGNAGTLMRLLAGVVASLPGTTVLDGDSSIRRRPMDRVATPLGLMGARVEGTGPRCLPPVAVTGARLSPIRYELPVASAQVKSCVLLAGCRAAGITEIIEPAPSRDHTERMLAAFGASVHREGSSVVIEGPAALVGRAVNVPGDLSSAAFLLAAALIVPGSDVTVRAVGLNPTRTGFLDVLSAAGAALTIESVADEGGEPCGSVRAVSSEFAGLRVAGDLVPRAIDEIPVLAMCACFATGTSEVSEAAELRVKESDRIASVVRAITSLGGVAEAGADSITISPSQLGPGTVDSNGDHRIAMAAVVGGLAIQGMTIVRDVGCIDTSFPGFADVLRTLGADIEEDFAG